MGMRTTPTSTPSRLSGALSRAQSAIMAQQTLGQSYQQLTRILPGNHDYSDSSTQDNYQPPQQLAESRGTSEPNEPPVDLADDFGKTGLHHAAKDGKQASLQQLIAAGADVNKRDQQGATPLLCAAQQGHDKVVQLLLEAGASVSIADQALWVPLHWAAQNGHDLVVELLVDAGAEIEIADGHGVRPLHLAAQSGNERCVELLLEAKNGATVDAVADPEGFTPLYMAARRGHQKIVALLLKAGAAVAASVGQGFTALHAAAEQGHCDVVKMLLRTGAAARSLTRHGSTPLHLAAWSGHLGTAQILMEAPGGGAGAVLARDSQGWTPLYLASRRGHNVLVEALVECAGTTADSDSLVRAAKSSAAAGHIGVFATLAKELGRQYPTAIPALLMGPDAPHASTALTAMINKCLADSAEIHEQKLTLKRERQQLAAEKAGLQHLVVQAAGMLKKARVAQCHCGDHCDAHMQEH